MTSKLSLKDIKILNVPSKNIDDSIKFSCSKKQYMPIILEWHCPNCGALRLKDYTKTYLDYPILGFIYVDDLYCPECDNFEAELEFKINVSIELTNITFPKIMRNNKDQILDNEEET
jgi:rubredoxin